MKSTEMVSDRDMAEPEVAPEYDTPGAEMASDEEEPPTAAELEEKCGALVDEPQILSSLSSTLRGTGYAGSTLPVQLLCLGLYSRHLERPISLVVRGESASGKSHAIKRALEFTSPDAYRTITAMSDKALYYDQRKFDHRMLIVFEGEGLKSDTVAYAMRSLLSEGRLEYSYTDFESKKTVQISKDGPTGLITSTAGRVDHELGTRMFSVPIDDSPTVTQAIMEIEAKRATGQIDTVDTSQFEAFDQWLAVNRKPIVIPYATKLAQASDGKAVRMRRDFPAVLGLIQTHALIHQKNRETDGANRVVANLDDYRVIHGLVSELIAYTSEKSVPQAVRETVDVLWDLTRQGADRAVTVNKVANALGVHRTTASRHLNRAATLGFAIKNRQQPGMPLTYDWGENMPEDSSVLPDPESLR